MITTLRGVVRGGRIELAAGPDLAEGQEVEVTLRPVGSTPEHDSGRVWGDGIRATAGCFADDVEFDAVMDQVQRDRKAAGRRTAELE